MNDRDRPRSTPPAPASRSTTVPASSGRVQFDSRGQAVWEWSVQTGMFDRNASTQRIRKLLDQPTGLEIVDEPPARAEPARPAAAPAARPAAAGAARPPAARERAAGFDPYERAPAGPRRPQPRESAGGDPYSSGPAKRPENVSFDPYRHGPRK